MVRTVGWFLLFLLGAISIVFLLVLGAVLLPSALLVRLAPDVPPEATRRIVAAALAIGVAMILAAWATPRAGMSRWWTLGMVLPVLNVLGVILISWRLAGHTVEGPAPSEAVPGRRVPAATLPASRKLSLPLAVVLVVALLGLLGAAGVLAYRVASVPSASTGSSEVAGTRASPPGEWPTTTSGRPVLPYKAYGEGLRAGQVVEIRRGDAVLQTASTDAQGRWSVDLQGDLFTNGETLSLWLDGIDTGRRFEPRGGQFPAAPGFALAGARVTATTARATSGTADELPPNCGVGDLPYKAYGSGIGPRQRVEAFFSGARVGQATADDAGNWSFNIDPKPPLVRGARVTFSVDGRDIQGVSIRFCSAQFPNPPGIMLGAR